MPKRRIRIRITVMLIVAIGCGFGVTVLDPGRAASFEADKNGNSASTQAKGGEQKRAARPPFAAKIAQARFEQESQLLILAVNFASFEESPVHLVAENFAFITDATHPGRIKNVELTEDALLIDLSYRLSADLSQVSEGRGRAAAPQAVLIGDLHHEPYSGLHSVTYAFRFPVHFVSKRNAPVTACRAPRGKQKVKLIFGYGVESPLAFERKFPDRNDQLGLDKALSEQWQRLLYTEAIEVDFGSGPKSGEAKGKAVLSQ